MKDSSMRFGTGQPPAIDGRRLMVRRNRPVIAAREPRWPEGVLETCDKLDHLYPDWAITWRAAGKSPGFDHPAAFLAFRLSTPMQICAPTADELTGSMELAPENAPRLRADFCCALAIDQHVGTRRRDLQARRDRMAQARHP